MAKRRINLDMTGVESYTRCPEGEWTARLKKIEMGEVQGSGDDCLKAQFEVCEGEAKGNTVFETFSLTEKALWKLKSFLQAVGMKADGKISLDLDKLIGKTCTIEVVHDEYNGNKRAKIASYSVIAAEPEEDEDDEDEEELERKPEKKAGKKPTPKKPVEPDEEDEDEDDVPPKPAKKVKDSGKPAKKIKKQPEPEPEDDDDDDWEEDDD